MDRHRPGLRTAVVVLLLVNVAATSVAAEPAQRRVLFDTDVTEVATVHTNGQTYVVYEYDNALPYASGLAVVSDGERITSRETVDEVFKALARRKATKFAPEARTIRRLRSVVDRSQAVQAATAEAIAALNDTFVYRKQLKETTVNDTTAWTAATRESSALETRFTGGLTGSEAKTLQKRLVAVHAAAEALETNATRVITLLQRRQEGEEINQTDLYRRYDAVYAELATMKQRVGEIRQDVAATTEASRRASSQASSTPEVGSELEQHFGALADELAAANSRLADAGPALEELRGVLPQVAADRRYQAKLTDRWEKRRGAVQKVYVTVVEGTIALAAGVIALFETGL